MALDVAFCVRFNTIRCSDVAGSSWLEGAVLDSSAKGLRMLTLSEISGTAIKKDCIGTAKVSVVSYLNYLRISALLRPQYSYPFYSYWIKGAVLNCSKSSEN